MGMCFCVLEIEGGSSRIVSTAKTHVKKIFGPMGTKGVGTDSSVHEDGGECLRHPGLASVPPFPGKMCKGRYSFTSLVLAS